MSRIHPAPRPAPASAGDAVVAAVRGAISVRANRAADIREATARLLDALIQRNGVSPERVVSAVFTATPDLTADFPAHAARRLGWTDVPLLGAVELGVPGAPRRIVRVLLTLRDVARGTRLVPVYLDEAAALRPDLSDAPAPATRPRRGRTRRIALIGLGQIGGSIGLALEDAGGWQRVGFDTRAAVRREALARGVVDETAPSLAAACRAAELALVCVPVDVLPRVLAQVAAALPAGAALLDTGSARGAGVTTALLRASARVRAVGGHPIAGNEHRGLAGARAQLFQGAPFALLPVRGPVPPVIHSLLHDLGAEPRVVSPSRHDQALARTSHLPWLVSRALSRLGARAASEHLAGPGFASMTRLAASDARVARAYARANAGNVRSAWRALRARLDRDVAALG
jgi:prephenate dehydrogenase